jgi:hypothetical protein
MDEEKKQHPVDTIATGDASAAAKSRDLDDAYDLYQGQDATNIDPQEARRVLRKIDWHVMPLLMGSYMLQYLDKSSINFASVFGLQDGTGLVGQDYAWLSSIFYFGNLPHVKPGDIVRMLLVKSLTRCLGYLFAQWPAGYLLQRLPTGKFIGATTFGNDSSLLPPFCKGSRD